MKTVTVTNPSNFNSILDFIQDRHFELSKLEHNSDAKTLSIPLTVISDHSSQPRRSYFFKTWKVPVVPATLIVRNVNQYYIHDDASIDGGTINTLSVQDKCLIIKCCEPVQIHIELSSLKLDLQISNTPVSEKTRFSLFSFPPTSA